MLGARATFMLVILRLLARVCPPLCSRAFSAPNQPHLRRFRGGADKGSWSRSKRAPSTPARLQDQLRAPTTSTRPCVADRGDASALGNGGPSESPLEGRGVQLVAGLRHEQPGICVPISSDSSHERQDSVSNRNATGPSRFGALDLNSLGLRALHRQDRQWNLDETPDTHGAQVRPAQPGPGIDQ